MKYKPYSILIPGSFPELDITSGGIRVMYGLYGALLAKGQIVYPNGSVTDESIGIYPEIITGNPLNTKHIVRYILNKPGTMGLGSSDGSFQPSPIEFAQTDVLWYFSRLFGESPTDNYMFLPILNTQLFKDQGKLRTKKAYFVGKGENTGEHPSDALLIDRRLAQDQQNLADLLNECEVLYCYDPVTAMTELARLCGCRVVIFPSSYTEVQFALYEPGQNGISWGGDKGVLLDTEKFRDHYLAMKEEFDWKLDRFIEETQAL